MEYKKCNLCPRNCNIDRYSSVGYCGMKDVMYVARIAPHYWEEPCLSGKSGSGAVFFSGCSLKCVYCQNYSIAHGKGSPIDVQTLADKMLGLQELGCNNINLVTATHYIPSIVESVKIARNKGLILPIVYNSSGYEKKEALKLLEGTVNIYLPDMKYIDSSLAKKYSNAYDYPEVVKEALAEMYRQVGKPTFYENGIMKSGMIVRVLALPECEKNTKEILKYLKNEYMNNIYISLMSQYTPIKTLNGFPELQNKLSKEEYDELCGYASGLRLKNVYLQEGESASESFIPDFDSNEI